MGFGFLLERGKEMKFDKEIFAVDVCDECDNDVFDAEESECFGMILCEDCRFDFAHTRSDYSDRMDERRQMGLVDF